MNKQTYLENDKVVDFIDWITPKISGEGNFYHKYFNSRSKTTWTCNSIYNAYENYEWPFNCSLQDKSKKGSTYHESEKVLTEIGIGIKHSLKKQDSDGVLAYCLSILEWGGVKRSNYSKLQNMGKSIIPYFENAIIKLNPETTNTSNVYPGIFMNSGFTKIYALIIDDFIIYDSRVGAALGLLVKQYLTDRNIAEIPDVLDFAYGNARTTSSDNGKMNKRNPSNGIYKFKALNNDATKHIKNNTYANWLLKVLSEHSKFRIANNPIRALESALFMIGYCVREDL